MLRYQEVKVERLVCTCDRCGREMEKDTGDFVEWQERFVFSFRAGYGSVFGDGNYIEGDFCQQCIADTLGKYLRVTDDDPFESKVKPKSDPEKAMQLYQYERVRETERMKREISAISQTTADRHARYDSLAAQLGVAIEQVPQMALELLEGKLLSEALEEVKPAEPSQSI